MKKSKRLVVLAIFILLFVAICSLTACVETVPNTETVPKLDSKNLEGWSVRFNDIWLDTKTTMAEFNLVDYVDTPMEIGFIGDSIHHLSANVYYNGKVQDDYILILDTSQYFDTDKNYWINLNQAEQPIQKAGDYRFFCGIANRNDCSMGAGGVGCGISHKFRLNVKVRYSL